MVNGGGCVVSEALTATVTLLFGDLVASTALASRLCLPTLSD